MTDLLDDDQPVYAMSVAAELSGLHPQTLRQYERIGWVSPDRSGGRNRRYSMRDILQLREVQRLAAEENAQLRKRLAVIEDAKNSTALVVWQPRRRRR